MLRLMGLSNTELAPGTSSRLRSGRAIRLAKKKFWFARTAEYLEVSTVYLLGNEDRTKNIKNILPYPDNQSLIPVLGEIHAGCPSYATECIEGYELADVKNRNNFV